MSDNIIMFPVGIPGLPEELKEFKLFAVEENSPFFLLKSHLEEKVCFILADPFVFFPDYQVELSGPDQKELEIYDLKDAAVFCVVNMSEGLSKATVNLTAPIIINVRTGRAKQIIIADDTYDIRHPLLLDKTTSAENVEEGE